VIDREKMPGFYWRYLRNKLMSFLSTISFLRLSLEELRDNNLFPRSANTSPMFKRIVQAAKEGKYNTAKDCLLNDKYLVFHHDFVSNICPNCRQRALH